MNIYIVKKAWRIGKSTNAAGLSLFSCYPDQIWKHWYTSHRTNIFSALTVGNKGRYTEPLFAVHSKISIFASFFTSNTMNVKELITHRYTHLWDLQQGKFLNQA